MELAEKKCEACEGGMSLLARDEAERLREQTPQWDIRDDTIERTFKFHNFIEAMKFAVRIAKIAEEENHHPDLHVSWGKLRVELTTHSIGGLSTNDFILAAKIDKLEEESKESQAI